MFSGEDFLGLPVDVEDAVKEDSYWCPCCGGDLVIKDGPVKIKHFAHKSRMMYVLALMLLSFRIHLCLVRSLIGEPYSTRQPDLS